MSRRGRGPWDRARSPGLHLLRRHLRGRLRRPGRLLLRVRAHRLDRLRRRRGEDTVAVLGHEDVVLDPHADAEEWGRDLLLVGSDVEARLDRQDHARLEEPPLPLRVVVAAPVVDVHPEPVRGAVHVEAGEVPLLDHLLPLPGEEPQLEEAVDEDLDRRVVDVLETPARPHLRDGRRAARRGRRGRPPPAPA